MAPVRGARRLSLTLAVPAARRRSIVARACREGWTWDRRTTPESTQGVCRPYLAVVVAAVAVKVGASRLQRCISRQDWEAVAVGSAAWVGASRHQLFTVREEDSEALTAVSVLAVGEWVVEGWAAASVLAVEGWVVEGWAASMAAVVVTAADIADLILQ